jgi:iron complex transport system ATP-binding protein
VLADVSFDVPRGEVVAVFGPNGAGKSTLLRLLAGELRPMAGRIEVLGRDAGRTPRRVMARLVAVVPQEEALLFPFTAGEVALMGRAPYVSRFALEGPGDVAAARRALEETDAIDLASRPFSELSGGERQRVLVARAFAQETELLLLDEPTAALDVRHRLDVYRLLAARNAARGATVVFASHDLDYAVRCARRVILLDRGRIRAYGEVREVLDPTLLRDVFGARAIVRDDEEAGAPQVSFYPLRD